MTPNPYLWAALGGLLYLALGGLACWLCWRRLSWLEKSVLWDDKVGAVFQITATALLWPVWLLTLAAVLLLWYWVGGD